MASIARIAFFLGKILNTRIALSWDSMGQRWFFWISFKIPCFEV